MSTRRSSAGDAPLLAWGEAMRRTRRCRSARRLIAGLAIGGIALGLTIVWPPVPRLVWNASASAPIGLYRVYPGASARAGDMVIAHLPARFRALAAERHYLPANVPLVKRVTAVAGSEVCAEGRMILVDGRLFAVRQSSDPHGRPLPGWEGCVRLRDRQLFLLMDAPDSFDGRYVGVTDDSDVVGRAVLLWRR
ncbi:S26 family signal peptidase [Sphingomonas asaccharolytica]|uniref:S26 family signal peptidase n=1 Tax=Sphingomonas asaccharolytica TaxID=40681 RepID=UPI00082E5BAE|nr:S26 family signal peptidase [Sphingomonas asaccharolytica]